MSPARPEQQSMTAEIERLAHSGLSNAQIAGRVGRSVRHVDGVVAAWRAARQADREPICRNKDAEFVSMVWQEAKRLGLAA